MQVGEYAALHGNSRAIAQYGSAEKPLPESSVRNFKRYYLEFKKQNPDTPTSEMVRQTKRGRPTLLPAEVDQQTQSYITSLRESGAPVTAKIVAAAALGIVQFHDRSLLKQYGGSIEITPHWTQSLLHRMQYVKRKGTKTARKLPTNFDAVKTQFHENFQELVKAHYIPSELIINWDQTGVKIVPIESWTLEKQGVKQVSIVAMDDKRQITALFAISLCGDLLPPQLLYQGVTRKCHPSQQLPEDWDVWHSENHWSTAESMCHYIEHIIIPYCNRKREELGLPPSQKCLAIFDVFAAHRHADVLRLLDENNICRLFVPASCTGELQPLDSNGGFNAAFKSDLKNRFSDFYASEILSGLEKGLAIGEIKVNMTLTALKDRHARWVLQSMEKLAKEKRMLQVGWKNTGLLDAYERCKAPVPNPPTPSSPMRNIFDILTI